MYKLVDINNSKTPQKLNTSLSSNVYIYIIET
jgi:hypothetical protein